MPPGKYIGSKDSASDPTKTKQWEGHLRHQEHLAEQERDRRARRAARLKRKAKP